MEHFAGRLRPPCGRHEREWRLLILSLDTIRVESIWPVEGGRRRYLSLRSARGQFSACPADPSATDRREGPPSMGVSKVVGFIIRGAEVGDKAPASGTGMVVKSAAGIH